MEVAAVARPYREMLAFICRRTYRDGMEGISLDDVAAAHPEAQVCCVDGVLHAFVPDGRGGGRELGADSEAELLAKLDG